MTIAETMTGFNLSDINYVERVLLEEKNKGFRATAIKVTPAAEVVVTLARADGKRNVIRFFAEN